MRVDSNTNGHRQWFYFSIKNAKKQTVTLNIYRFKKKFSLFQRGMKPYIRSRKQGNDWKPGGYNIAYKQQKIARNSNIGDRKPTYYLSFNYIFEHQNDEVFFAACIPYTYSFLTKQLQYYEKQAQKKFKDLLSFKVSRLTKSMCGLVVPLITIESKQNEYKDEETQCQHTRDKTTISQTYKSTNNKKYVIINARTHSGETCCSWVLDGILQQITSNRYVAQWICDQNICLKIVPMLNPDGVFIGNYRTGIIGDDFNRKFFSGKKDYFPEIHSIKKLVNQCKKLGKVELFLDLHGHSVLKNSFIYGPLQEMFSKFQLKNLPFALWHYSKYFRLSSCKFKLEKDKIETARVFFQINEGILSYTCQNSLGLFYQQKQTFQMVSQDWKNLGMSMAYSFYDCFAKNNPSIYPSPHHISEKKQDKNRQQQSKNRHQSSKNRLPQVIVPFTANKKHSLSKKQKEESFCHAKKLSGYGDNYNYSANLQRRASRIQEMPSINKQIIQQQQNINKIPISYTTNLSKDICFEKTRQKIQKQKKQTFLPNDTKSIFKIKKQAPKQDIIRSKFKIKKITEAMNIDNVKSSKNASLYHKLQENNMQMEPIIQKSKTKQVFQELSILRANTYDNHQLQNQFEKFEEQEVKYNDPLLQVIQQNFSEQYESINDSDSESDDLCFQQKKYILEHIKANRKNTVSRCQDSDSDKQPEQTDNQYTTTNINAFKEIRFKSVQHHMNITNHKVSVPSKSVKKDYSKLKEGTQKSLRRQKLQDLFQDEEQQMISMIQKKKLTQRPAIRHLRQPYTLMKFKPNK